MLKDSLPSLPKVEEVRDKTDKLRVEQQEIEQLKKEVELLQNRVKFKKDQPSMQSALQQEDKLRELKRVINDYKATYTRLQLEQQENEKAARKQTLALVDETQKSRDYKLQVQNITIRRRSNLSYSNLSSMSTPEPAALTEHRITPEQRMISLASQLKNGIKIQLRQMSVSKNKHNEQISQLYSDI